MDGLRWLLLLLGLLVIAGVYWYSRRERERASRGPADDVRITPTLDEERAEPTAEEIAAAEPRAHVPQKIVTVRLVARNGASFRGDELILSLRGIGLRHGKFGIFHRYDGSDEDQTIFSAASLVEPGSFDMSNIKEQEIPGISMFLVLPGPVDGVEAFDLMITAAKALSKALNGELLDESGSTLSIQRERYLREEIIQFQHSHLVA
jgi:cell division protein ZipA